MLLPHGSVHPALHLVSDCLQLSDQALGLRLPLDREPCACCRQYPGAATGRRLRSSHPAVSAFPEVAVGSACTSTFSELARRSLELRPAHSRRHLYVTSYTEGFSHFVTSMTAPVASGWSVRRVGFAPTGKRRLRTAHAKSSHSRVLEMAPAHEGRRFATALRRPSVTRRALRRCAIGDSRGTRDWRSRAPSLPRSRAREHWGQAGRRGR